MKFNIETWEIRNLIRLYDQGKLNLSPPYQRNFIWSKKDQDELIDSILFKEFPLPTFFLHETDSGAFDVVDGQQRTRTILAYFNQHFRDPDEEATVSLSKENFESFKLSVTVIETAQDQDTMEEFYARVNKTGKKLNKPELAKAEYFFTNYLALNEELAGGEKFQSLNIFTEASTKRMNDIDFVSELVALIKFGESDKKEKVDILYESDINTDESQVLKNSFNDIISIFFQWSQVFPLKKTRYKQRNDFYTIFGFLLAYQKLFTSDELLDVYKVLLSIESEVSPSNDLCAPLKEYAINCVSQSNSKKARISRLRFIEALFLNNEETSNEVQAKLIDYYSLEEPLIKITKELYTINYQKILDEKEISLN